MPKSSFTAKHLRPISLSPSTSRSTAKPTSPTCELPKAAETKTATETTTSPTPARRNSILAYTPLISRPRQTLTTLILVARRAEREFQRTQSGLENRALLRKDSSHRGGGIDRQRER